MPTLTVRSAYLNLINAIDQSSIKGVKAALAHTNVKDFINQDPRGYNNPPPLKQALSKKTVDVQIVKALLNVASIEANQPEFLTLLLNAKLSPADTQAIHALMQQRGLQQALPMEWTVKATSSKVEEGYEMVNESDCTAAPVSAAPSLVSSQFTIGAAFSGLAKSVPFLNQFFASRNNSA